MSVNVPYLQWRLYTANGIRYKLLSRTGGVTAETAEAREVYIIRSVDLLNFLLESFPAPTKVKDGLTYVPPRSMPGWPFLVTRNVDYEGLTGSKPIDPFLTDLLAPPGTYEGFLRVTITYRNLKEVPDSNLEITAACSAEVLSLPTSGKSRWGMPGTGTSPGEAVQHPNVPATILVPQTEWTVRWKTLPYTFFTATMANKLRSKVGQVNKAVMKQLFDAPAETILFVGWDYARAYDFRYGVVVNNDPDQPYVQLTLKFLEKNFEDAWGEQVTHNHFWQEGVGFRRLLVDGKNGVYGSTDLDNIFDVEPAED